MHDPPAYLWAIIIAGPTAVAGLTCAVLYSGAERAGLGRRRAALLAGAAAVVLGGWLTASAVIADHGWYHTLPWFPVAITGYLGLLLALSRIPMVARALAAPGMVSRLELPHTPRVAGVAFLLYLALGHLPALFALPAGLGDIAAGIAAPLVARRLAQGRGRRAALWFNAFGLTDLVTALPLGALTGFGLLNVTPSSAPITELPLALIRQPPYRCCSPCISRPCSRSPEPRNQRRQPPARSFPASCRALLWRHARHPAPGESTQRTRRQGSALSTRSRRRPPARAPTGAPPICSPASSWSPSPTRRAIRPHDCT